MNSDDWIKERINLAAEHEELRSRYTSTLSLLSKNIDELLKKDRSFESLREIQEFQHRLSQEKGRGLETTIVEGWIGLGVVHCHNSSHSQEELAKTKELVLFIQKQVKGLLERFPQLREEISGELKELLCL